ncbi:uncharacterized protein LOC111000433 [Pieris rapae]|uniref:uncharacterized protein LOC111000433 n=1 Tax=Pieris rapae TaxID=64459 RepID=UPI001E27A2AA|nr:uncharacterized protein LOC111000433 [Pieris rapae]
MGATKLCIYTAFIFAVVNEVSPYEYNNNDSANRIRRQIPFADMNPFYLSFESDPYTSGVHNFGLMVPPPINYEVPGAEKAYRCSLIKCDPGTQTGAVCACNFNTGKVVSFKNQCDVIKHNCRFDTEFRVILHEICPWEFQSRRDNKPMNFDYTNSKYYN